jgi:phosphosulfolactate synthase
VDARLPYDVMPDARFLDLPERDEKPRERGLTFAVDGGVLLGELQPLLEAHGAWLDLWKVGWGSAYLDPTVAQKVARLREHRVLACTGGTLLEIAAHQGRVDECVEWSLATGFGCIEVSDGLCLMGRETKSAVVRRVARDAVCIAEVGAKDASRRAEADDWVRAALDDLDAGASWVIAEGRESGTVGIYEADGAVRTDIVDALLDRVGATQLVFEAPRRHQQAWFVRHVGPNVNLANIAPRDVIGLEALRLGLRADTTLAIHGARSAARA